MDYLSVILQQIKDPLLNAGQWGPDETAKHTRLHSSFLATKDQAVQYRLAQSGLQLCAMEKQGWMLHSGVMMWTGEGKRRRWSVRRAKPERE